MSIVIRDNRPEDRVVRITLCHSERRNALSYDMLDALEDTLRTVAEDPAFNAVIIRADGPVFSAGHDLHEILEQSVDEVWNLFEKCRTVMATIRKVPQVVIAEVSGIATAAGCQLVAAADLAVAGETARFATPGVRIGYFCGSPSVQVSRNLPLKIAAELLFTGEYLSAQDAHRHGFINRVVPDDQVEMEALRLAGQVTRWSRPVLAAGKRLLYQQREMTEDGAARYAVEFMARQSRMPDAVEGITAFFEKRPPAWSDR